MNRTIPIIALLLSICAIAYAVWLQQSLTDRATEAVAAALDEAEVRDRAQATALVAEFVEELKARVQEAKQEYQDDIERTESKVAEIVKQAETFIQQWSAQAEQDLEQLREKIDELQDETRQEMAEQLERLQQQTGTAEPASAEATQDTVEPLP